jgi:hypothetical protein
MSNPFASGYVVRRASHLLGKAFRETGQAMDRVGIVTSETDFYKETFSRNRPIMSLFDKVEKKMFTIDKMHQNS